MGTAPRLDEPALDGLTLARPQPSPAAEAAPANGLWERLARRGLTVADPPRERRRMRAVNQSALLAVLNIGAFAGGYLACGLFDLAAVALACALVPLIALGLHGRGRRATAPLLVLIPPNLIVAFAVIRLGPGVGFQSYFFLFSAVAFLLAAGRWQRWSLAALPGLLCVGLQLLPPLPTVAVPAPVRLVLALLAAVSTMGLLAYLISVYRADADESERLLAREYARSQQLLLNILPSPIAERLKLGEDQIADGFAEATVLFADLVGFTELSQRLRPGELVELMNRIFYRFDALCDEHGLEKIKTIGDAYMVAGGLTGGQADDPARVARFALAMLSALEEVGRESGYDLALRVGINTGAVVAGVIGRHRSIYDVWGDAVNTASRMESSGVPGRIQVTRATYERLAEEFVFEPRGSIQVKGKGQMETFFLLGPRPPAAAA